MLDELNELEKIGFAFISGMVAGQALKVADEEVEAEEKVENKNETKVVTGFLKGKEAEKFKEFLEKMGVE